MTRRDWVLALGAGICGSLLPACLRLAVDGASAAPQPAKVRVQDAGNSTLAQGPGSPYRSLSDPPAPQPTQPPERIDRSNYPERKAEPDRLPPPDPPAPAAESSRPAPVEEAPSMPARTSVPKPPREAPVLAALRCFLEKRPAEAIGCLKECDKLSQEALLSVLPLAARLGEGNLEQANAEEVGLLVDQLNSLQAPLRTRAPLVIDQMCFCRHMDTFGVYDQLPDEPLFQSGEWALVYIELRNFSCEKRERTPGQATYLTRLTSSAEIRDYAGHKVWPTGPDRLVFRRKGPDESRSLWHDYFDNCSFRVPDLPSGRYTLWIQVEDVPTKRTVRRSLDFRVTGTVPVRGS